MPGQNVYDDDAFFTGYQHMRVAGAGLNEALEQPALRALLPAVLEADAVDLGCGDGALSRGLADAPTQADRPSGGHLPHRHRNAGAARCAGPLHQDRAT